MIEQKVPRNKNCSQPYKNGTDMIGQHSTSAALTAHALCTLCKRHTTLAHYRASYPDNKLYIHNIGITTVQLWTNPAFGVRPSFS